MSKATSAFSTRSLISSPRKGPHIHLSMLSRHLKISKPIWHYLHHRRPLKFASVEWLWQAITPMQDIGNLTRISSDKSGHSKRRRPHPSPPPTPWGREGRRGACRTVGENRAGHRYMQTRGGRVKTYSAWAAEVCRPITRQNQTKHKHEDHAGKRGTFFRTGETLTKGFAEVRPFLCLVLVPVPECIRLSVSHTMISQP